MDYPFVEVLWLDAQSVATWVSPEDLPTPVSVTSRGWLVADLTGYITLVSTIHADAFGEVITIPRGMVQSVEELHLVGTVH